MKSRLIIVGLAALAIWVVGRGAESPAPAVAPAVAEQRPLAKAPPTSVVEPNNPTELLARMIMEKRQGRPIDPADPADPADEKELAKLIESLNLASEEEKRQLLLKALNVPSSQEERDRQIREAERQLAAAYNEAKEALEDICRILDRGRIDSRECWRGVKLWMERNAPR